MSDDNKRYDEWTDGPELSRDEARKRAAREESDSSLQGESADTLRERQRLAQLEMMDRWIGGVLAEQRRSRRWKLFFRFLFAALIIWMYWRVAHVPGGQAIGALEIWFEKMTKRIGRLFRRRSVKIDLAAAE